MEVGDGELGAAAGARFWRTMSRELRVFLLLVPALAVLSMPLSWLLLEHARWALIPQIQPMRARSCLARGRDHELGRFCVRALR